MIGFIKDNQDKKEFKEATKIERHFEDEPKEVAYKSREMKMDVQKPKVYVGLKAKESNLSGEEMLKHELSGANRT